MYASERERRVVECIEAGRKEEAFDLLFTLYSRKIYHLALVLMRNPAEAEDAAQDVLVKLWRALPTYDGSASFSTWLYVIARNTCFTRMRRNRFQELPSETDGPSVAGRVHPGTPSDATVDSERILAQLTEDQRRVMELFYLEGRSTDEVSKILGMAPATVRSHLYRARKRAANLLQERNLP